MESDLQPNHHNLLHHHQQQQMNSGLMRYRSAPNSYFANFLDSEDCEVFLNHRPSSPETDRIISRFFTSSAAGAGGVDGGDDSSSRNHGEIRQNSQPKTTQQNQLMAPMKLEEEAIQPLQQSNYSSASHMMYQNNNPSPLPNQINPGPSGSAMDGSFRVPSSMGTDRFPQMKMGSGSNSNLIRHSSSPAGLFSNINIENGYVTLRGMGNFGGGNGNASGETSFFTTSRMKNQLNFASVPPSSSGLMTPISEHANTNMGPSSPENEIFREKRSSSFITDFPIDSWVDSALMTDNFSGLKRARDDTLSGLIAMENQSDPPPLSRHLSLPNPKTSAEMAAMEQLLQFQDSVPFKIRAKRGCATHPRSIAERVRRTGISERMRKLQELVPNMDKQTNTADMLDLAVDYIKDLQMEVKTLADNRAKCTCSSNQKL